MYKKEDEEFPGSPVVRAPLHSAAKTKQNKTKQKNIKMNGQQRQSLEDCRFNPKYVSTYIEIVTKECDTLSPLLFNIMLKVLVNTIRILRIEKKRQSFFYLEIISLYSEESTN